MMWAATERITDLGSEEPADPFGATFRAAQKV